MHAEEMEKGVCEKEFLALKKCFRKVRITQRTAQSLPVVKRFHRRCFHIHTTVGEANSEVIRRKRYIAVSSETIMYNSVNMNKACISDFLQADYRTSKKASPRPYLCAGSSQINRSDTS